MKTTDNTTPAVDYEQQRIDFNKKLRPFPASIFEFRFQGNSMTEHNILDGDLLLIDRMLKPTDGCIAIVVFENAFLCRQILYSRKWGCWVFRYREKWHRVTEIFGIATYSIHTLNGSPL